MDVFANIRRALSDPQHVLSLLGLLAGARREGRGYKILCLVHAERTPSCDVNLGPDGTIRVHCKGCGWSGDALHLVSAARGYNPRKIERPALEEAARLAGVDIEPQAAGAPRTRPAPAPPRFTPPPIVRPPRAELEALWRAASPVNLTQVDPHPSDLDVSRFCAHRRWWPDTVAALKVVRALPLEHAWPAWWPGTWSPGWRLATLAYEVDGAAASIHARSIDDKTPKTRWPKDCASSRLFFATIAGRKVLTGQPLQGLAGVILCEGITDFITAALEVEASGRPYAVLGGTSGSFEALEDLAPRWPAGVPAVIAVDHDGPGEKYARTITERLKGIDVRRWRPLARSAA